MVYPRNPAAFRRRNGLFGVHKGPWEDHTTIDPLSRLGKLFSMEIVLFQEIITLGCIGRHYTGIPLERTPLFLQTC